MYDRIIPAAGIDSMHTSCISYVCQLINFNSIIRNVVLEPFYNLSFYDSQETTASEVEHFYPPQLQK